MKIHWIAGVHIAFLTACAPTVIQHKMLKLDPGALMVPTTVTFTGTLPCPECDGRRVTLNLRPDRTFLLRLTYTGVSSEVPELTFIDLGRWTISEDQRRMTLHGGTGLPHLLTISDYDTLRVMDVEGKDSSACDSCTLVRRVWVDPFMQPFQLWGLYSYNGEEGRFTEQYTGRQFHVSARGDSRTLERAYRRTTGESGRPLFATVLGHFETVVGHDGGKREVLIVDRFEGLLTESMQVRRTLEKEYPEAMMVEGRRVRNGPMQ